MMVQNKNNVLNSANLLIQQFLFYFIVLYNVACIIDRFIGRFVRNKNACVLRKALRHGNISFASYVTIGHLNTERQFVWQTKYSRVCLLKENQEI